MAGLPSELTPAAKRLAMEAKRRLVKLRGTGPPKVDIDKVCHRPQASLVKSLVLGRIRNLSVLAGRQSGKSHGGSALAPMLAVLAQPGVNAIVVTATDASCEKMAFLPATVINRDLGLGGKPNYSAGDRCIEFPNGSIVYYLGANNQRTIDRLRGTPNLILCVIDEAGIYASDMLAAMIKAVRPGLRPRRGKLCVMGTPSPAGRQGTWFEITENPEYEQHRFGYRDNDRVQDFAEVEKTIDEDLRAQFPDLTPEQARLTAWFLREYGDENGPQFVVDLAEKVYQLTDANLVDAIPGDTDTHASAGDLGVSACDALVTGGWYGERPGGLWVVEQKEASGQDTLAFAGMVEDLWLRRHPLDIAIDPGGLGQKTIMTVQSLFPTIPVSEAVKGPIGIQVRAVNTLLSGGLGWRLKIRRGSKLAMELAHPTWVDGIVGGEIDEHGKHSDLVPALRYLCIKLLRGLLPEVPAARTAADLAREKYLEGIRKAERNKLAQQATDRSYDPGEFSEDLTDDLYE